jgi:hypothetical protein
MKKKTSDPFLTDRLGQKTISSYCPFKYGMKKNGGLKKNFFYLPGDHRPSADHLDNVQENVAGRRAAAGIAGGSLGEQPTAGRHARCVKGLGASPEQGREEHGAVQEGHRLTHQAV